MGKFLAVIAAVIGVMVLVLALGLLLTYPLMWMANYLFAPSFLTFVFGTPQLTFWKTLVLSTFLSWTVKSSSTSSSK